MHRLLTFRRARTYAVALLVLYAAAYGYALSAGSPPLNGAGQPIGGDYIAFHAAGRLLLTGHAAGLYDHSAVSEVQGALLGGRVPDFYDAFRNPPFAALPFVPLAVFDLLPGFVIWSLISAACLGVALWLLVGEVPWLKARWRGLVILVLAFPPVYFGLIDGENATISLLLFVLMYRALVREQDAVAGVLAAVGLFKPQLFVVFPLVLLARRSWRGLLAYGLTSLVLAVISLALVGPAGLQAWLRILIEPETGNAAVNGWRMVSLKSFFDVLLPGHGLLALGLYVAMGVVLLSSLVFVWAKRPASLRLAWIFTTLVAVLVDPHLVDYDLTVLVPAGILAAVLVPSVRWWMVLLYPMLLFRAELPLADTAVQLNVVVLMMMTVTVARVCFAGKSASFYPRFDEPKLDGASAA